MKRILLSLLMVGVLVMTLAGCKKASSELILGSWERDSLYWKVSGSPNPTSNYDYGGPVSEISGVYPMEVVFCEDNTGVLTEGGLYGGRKMQFTYSIQGNSGVITPIAAEQKAMTTTYTIQDIAADRMTICEKTVTENYSDHHGDTTPYTRVEDYYHHFKKI